MDLSVVWLHCDAEMIISKGQVINYYTYWRTQAHQASCHPAGPAAVCEMFRRRGMSPGSSCSYLLALTCSVFSPGQAKEEETTSKEREQGSQSQRWAWEWTLLSSALRQPVRRRWSQGESTWWIAPFPGFFELCCYCRNSPWEAPLANTLWSRGSTTRVHSHRRLANLQKHRHITVGVKEGAFPPTLLG